MIPNSTIQSGQLGKASARVGPRERLFISLSKVDNYKKYTRGPVSKKKKNLQVIITLLHPIYSIGRPRANDDG